MELLHVSFQGQSGRRNQNLQFPTRRQCKLHPRKFNARFICQVREPQDLVADVMVSTMGTSRAGLLLDQSVRKRHDGSWEVFETSRTSLVNNYPIYRVANFVGVRPIEHNDEAVVAELLS